MVRAWVVRGAGALAEAQVFLWVRRTARGCGSVWSEVMSVKDYRHCLRCVLCTRWEGALRGMLDAAWHDASHSFQGASGLPMGPQHGPSCGSVYSEVMSLRIVVTAQRVCHVTRMHPTRLPNNGRGVATMCR